MANIATYWQNGDTIDYKNETGAKIAAGSCVLIGAVLGVAGGDIEKDEVGALVVSGVFEIPKKAAVALTVGQRVKYTDTDGIDAATGADDAVGYAVEAADADAGTALVKLLG